MAKKHSKGYAKNQFCAIRTGSKSKCKCPSPNNYVKNCEVPKYTFVQGSKKKINKKFEAHHIVCVASVSEFLVGNIVAKPLLTKTRWCINDKHNMVAMPLWGHTIQHYCGGFFGLVDSSVPTPFANVPQHDYDHNSTGGYKSEIDKDMGLIAKGVQRLAAKGHEEPEKKLADALKANSDKFRNQLTAVRGLRVGGTHAAWDKGSREPNSDWYLPFSMAKDGVADVRGFPAKDLNGKGKLAEKIKAMKEAFANWN